MAQIDKPNLHFNTVLYTGNGSASNAQTGVGFQPDFLWIKNRTAAQEHWLADAVRGTTKFLESNSNNAESSDGATGLASFDSDGFTVNGSARTNQNSASMVAWNWKANGSGSSNSDGTITATVSANTTAGFSIVKYTGNATNSTVGHGLGVTPQVVIVKNLDSSGASAEHWRVQHHKVAASKVLYLNRTVAEDSNGDFQSTYPTSSTFSISSADGCNKNGEENIAYCFAEKKGYSKFGYYNGNGDADGTFVYTGFKPAFVMNKKTDGTMDWHIWDNKRNSYNVINKLVYPNLSNAEDTLTSLDFVSNGFKIKANNSFLNASGSPYIYMAFAENPIVGSNNIPATAK
tara:strand:+ start:40 stop:1077 length:1038 start_codon:yes stop_codon:yes gene_type:complete